MGKRIRGIFEVVTDVNHPLTGKEVLSKEQIKEALDKHASSIRDSAYILHDADPYLEDNVKAETARLRTRYEKESEGIPWEKYYQLKHKAEHGKNKPPHWHIVLRLKEAQAPETVAKWFGIPANFVEVARGARGRSNEIVFYDKLRYLTHEAPEEVAKGKHVYSDEYVCASFDFRGFLTSIELKMSRFGNRTADEDIMLNVMQGKMTLREVREYFPEVYASKLQTLQKLRADYISTCMPLPTFRLNFYVDGAGGIGKNSACKAIARALCPDLLEEDCYFETGGHGVAFQGYDGQPVVIWNDVRSATLVQRFGRGEIFDIFDSHPSSAQHNVKYSAVKLTNSINIINGVESYQSFLDGLAGDYTDRYGNEYKAEDKGQAYRRFPVILCLREQDFDVLLNRGVAEGTRDFGSYIAYKGLVGSFARVSMKLEGRAKRVVESKMLEPVLEVAERVKKKERDKIESPDEIPEEFKNYGKMINQDDFGLRPKESKDEALANPFRKFALSD